MSETPWIVRILRNQLRGVTWASGSDYAEEDYIFHHHSSDYAFATLYLDQHGSYTLYEAINDRWQGIELEDEKLIGERLTPQQAVNALVNLQKRLFGWADYPRVIDPSECVGPRGSFMPEPRGATGCKTMDYETIFDGEQS